jgi:hypothetical protein
MYFHDFISYNSKIHSDSTLEGQPKMNREKKATSSKSWIEQLVAKAGN